MKSSDAMQWLDDHGGRWCVRATRARCVVVATLGADQAKAAFRSLEPEAVSAALVCAVRKLRLVVPNTRQSDDTFRDSVFP